MSAGGFRGAEQPFCAQRVCGPASNRVRGAAEMAAVVSELRSALARLVGDPAADLATVTALDEAPVTGDQVLLERLVNHLLGSAERYNVGGAVEISTTARDGTSVLRVINTGAVVPAEMAERLLVPFAGSMTAPATTVRSRSHPGFIHRHRAWRDRGRGCGARRRA